MTPARARPGYAFLVTVLVVGLIASGAVATLLLLGTSVLRSAMTLEHAARAVMRAHSCAERALAELRADLSYAGGEELTLADGTTCAVYGVTGFGNSDRTVCVEATDGGVTRRTEIEIDIVLPDTRIAAWREVSQIAACQ